jgi:hypothetical protein
MVRFEGGRGQVRIIAAKSNTVDPQPSPEGEMMETVMKRRVARRKSPTDDVWIIHVSRAVDQSVDVANNPLRINTHAYMHARWNNHYVRWMRCRRVLSRMSVVRTGGFSCFVVSKMSEGMDEQATDRNVTFESM